MLLNSPIRWWFLQSAIFHKRLPYNLLLKTFSKKLFMSSEEMNASSKMKPPNILIFTGIDSKLEHFEICKGNISKSINTDCYIIYPLSVKQIEANEPWEDNSTLLINFCEHLSPNIQFSFLKYFENGGRLLSFCSDLIVPGIKIQKLNNEQKPNVKLHYKSWNEEIDTQGAKFKVILDRNHSNTHILGKDILNAPLIIETSSESVGKAIVAQVDLSSQHPTIQNILRDLLSENFHLNCYSEIHEANITQGYLYSKSDKDCKIIQEFIEKYVDRNNLIVLKNCKVNFNAKLNIDAENVYNVALWREITRVETFFNIEEYFSQLCTRHLGRSVIYSEIVNSTMDFIEGLKEDLGLVVISKKQIGGKGRGGNKWLSPEGCAMFTCQINIDLNSKMGQAIPFVQHLGALSIVHAIRNSPGYETLDVCLKWPNDIYIGKTTKIGGVLVSSIINMNDVVCSLGCGVNLSNAFPTSCINSLIEQKNKRDGTKLAKLSSEWLIANALNNLESFIEKYQIHGAQHSINLYYRYWIHGGQELTIGETGQLVKVKGLDEYGYLTVVDKNDAEISLQPNGNSLDMMKNLIKIKT